MKKYTSLLLMTAVLSIMTVGNLLFRSWDVHAVESTQTGAAVMPLEEPLESTNGGVMNEKSDYVLPYPGILPDHPLYFLKDFRDKIIEMLIVDPERKSEFYLLQSDKFLNAAVSLLDKNQSDKTVIVLSKSADRMTMAVAELGGMKANGRQIAAGSIDRLQKAIAKHSEVLQEMAEKIDTAQAVASLRKAEEELMKLK